MSKKTKLPPLYHRDSKGRLRVWFVWTEGADVCSKAGLCVDDEGTPSKKLTAARRTCVAKNVGLSTATTPEEQATRESAADWTHKHKRKYSTDIPAEDAVLPLPMLAKSFFNKNGSLTTHAKKVSYPADVQPKLNGVRCMARRVAGEIVLHSRNGLPYDVPHIAQQLGKWLPEGLELDGEIYKHGMSLQRIVSLVKRPRAESLVLGYHVYDVPRVEGEAGWMWVHRAAHVAHMVKESASIQRVGHVVAENADDVQAYHDRFRERGFEGAIVRLLDGEYRYGYRSAALLKVKAFMDGEFVVVGCEQGVGKDKGTATFVCDLGEGRTFKASMKGTIDERRAFWDLRASYKGQKLTVEFFGYTDAGKPFHPTGVAFRDPRDLPE